MCSSDRSKWFQQRHLHITTIPVKKVSKKLTKGNIEGLDAGCHTVPIPRRVSDVGGLKAPLDCQENWSVCLTSEFKSCKETTEKRW